MSLDVAKIKPDFPILEREVNGKRLVYLDSASSSQKPDRGARRDGPPLPRRRTPTCTAACTRSPRRAPRAYEARPGQGRPLRQRPRDRGDRVHRNVTEAINLVAYTWGRAEPERGRRRRAQRDGAPRQHRAVAHARRGARHRAALDPAHRRLPPRPHRRSATSSTAPSCSRSPRCRTCSARSTTSGRSPTPRTRPARSCSSTRARPCRTCPSTCRTGTPTSSAFTGAQDARPDRHRRALGPRASCSRPCRRSSAAAR